MYQEKRQGWLKHIDFIILDVIILQAAFLLAYFARLGFVNPYRYSMYRDMSLFLVLIDVIILLMTTALKNILKRGYYKEAVFCLKHTAYITLLAVFYLFSIQSGDDYSRIILMLTGVFYFPLIYLFRLGWKKVLKHRNINQTHTSTLLVSTADLVEGSIKTIQESSTGSVNLSGIILLDETKVGEMIGEIPVVADKKAMVNYICRNWVNEILFVMPANDMELSEMIDEIVEAGITVHLSLGAAKSEVGKKQLIENIYGYTVMTTSINYLTFRQVFFKRTIDIVGGLVGCIIAAFAMLVVGPIIYIQSPGPIIFKQERIGRGGKKFRIYKLRSMVMDAEARKKELMNQNRVADGMMFKVKYDPRIIGSKRLPDGTIKKGIGHFIRDWSIDELPQFFNVLKGDMSLVGTRPPTVDEWEKYELRHRVRMAFRPGITGMWQISGRSNITDFDEVVKLDTHYISEWDFGLDLRILWGTVKVLLHRSGAM